MLSEPSVTTLSGPIVSNPPVPGTTSPLRRPRAIGPSEPSSASGHTDATTRSASAPPAIRAAQASSCHGAS